MKVISSKNIDKRTIKDIGIIVDDVIITPPLCPICHKEALLTNMSDEDYIQCAECGEITKVKIKELTKDDIKLLQQISRG